VLPRAKRFPKLDALLVRPKAKKAQTWQEQLSIAKLWAAQAGGRINTPKAK
jgi:hypothetical protein